MADTTAPVDQQATLESPDPDSVTLKLTENPPEQNAAERTFEQKATRLQLEDEERDKLARLLDQAIQAIADERQEGEWDTNWDLWEDMYFGVLQDRPAGQANVHVPLSQEVVDTALAVVDRTLFSAKPWLQVEPREAMDVAQAKRKEAHLDYALNVEMQAKAKLEPVVWEAAALGTGVLYLPWLREVERIRDEETYDGLREADLTRFLEKYPKAQKDHPEVWGKLNRGETVTFTVNYDEARQDCPEPTYIPLRDWRVRPTAKWHKLHRERYVGHVFHLRYADIEEQVDREYYDQVLSRLAFRWDTMTGQFVDDPTFQDKDYEIETGILRWHRAGDSRERRYLVDYHRESRTVLRILHYPYWHNRPDYIPWYFQQSRRYIYGVGLLQKVEHSQFEANAAHSLTLDAVAFGAIPMFKARKGQEANFNPMRDGMYAGKVWYFDNPESDAQAFQTGINAAVQVLLNLEDRASRHAELSTGSTQNVSGLESPRDANAPGNKTIALIQQAHVRIAKYLSTLGWSLSELGFQTSELYYQFSPKGRVYRVMGPEGTPVFETISRQELRLRADYTPHGSTTALNPEKEKAETMEMASLLLKLPEVAQSAIRRLAVLELMLEVAGADWAKLKSKLMPPPEEIEVMRQEEAIKLQQRQAALQTAQTPGIPAPGQPPGNPAVGQLAGVPTNGNAPRIDPMLAAMLGGGMR